MQKILVANRGEIAVRIIATCRRMGIRSVAVFSAADRDALHVRRADEAAYIGPASVEESYLNSERILQAARDTGTDGLHPGYGFLSENADFAAAVEAAGLTWIGPPPAAMTAMASKIRARDIAVKHGVPVLPALTLESTAQPDPQALANLGLPLLIKAAAGGGGIGMCEVHAVEGLELAISQARAQAERQFNDGSLLLERLVSGARHVEVQVVGDRQGALLHLHDRDCSLQRRRQKLLEEAPAPGLSPALRDRLRCAAMRLAAAVDYHSVGTVEFLVQGEEFFLLEMNTRLQVEHGVTEAICGLDLVQMQIDIADGRALALTQDDIIPVGHAIEARIYAEDPRRQFAPATGTISAFHCPQDQQLRVDTGVHEGSEVSHHYDGLLCKLIASGADRPAATRRLSTALDTLVIAGVTTNQRFLQALLRDHSWRDGVMHTTRLEDELQRYLSLSAIPEQDLALALAAATVWQFLRSPPDADRAPWPGGFHYLRQSCWECGGESRTLDWRWAPGGSFHFTDPDHVLQVTAHELPRGNSLQIRCGGILRRFQFHPAGLALTVHESSIGSISLRQRRPGGPVESSTEQTHCISAGPGLVLKLLVEPGQDVERGDRLLVIESMKMETTLAARCSGRVATLNTTAGALVETGQLLLTVTPRTESAE